MIIIHIPNNNIEERIYIIELFFENLLGINITISISDIDNYEIILPNKKKLIIIDSFFSKFVTPLSYLDVENIPQKIEYYSNDFIIEHDIPVIFGNNSFVIEKDEINCGIDIFASSFFMLSRWEEFVNHERDNLGRFSAYSSLAYKNDFLHRPIVNEYLEMLWNMILYLGYEGSRKERKYELILTHDIDFLTRSRIKWGYDIIRTFLKNSSLKDFFNSIVNYIKGKNPYDIFDYLMSISDDFGLKSHFYFMADNHSSYATDFYLNDNRFYKILDRIKDNGHVIGFHPGIKTFKNERIWNIEKSLLDTSLGFKCYEGRQHFLMVDINETFKIWEKAGMQYDSSLGYPEELGFRCGTGDMFYLFNIINRRRYNLIERPLVFMDVTLDKLFIDDKECSDVLNYYKTIGEKYKMMSTFLFHNSTSNVFANDNYFNIIKLLNEATF